MTTINIRIEQEEDQLKRFAIGRGWEEFKIELGKDSTGLETTTEVENTETYQEFAKKQIETILIENLSFFVNRDIQEEERASAENRMSLIHQGLKSQILVE